MKLLLEPMISVKNSTNEQTHAVGRGFAAPLMQALYAI
jgi:hypothetical protein